MKLDETSSIRLSCLRFPLIVCVIFIHTYGFGLAATPSQGFFLTLQNFISQGVARIAVPLFFIMSGYLFFFFFDGSFKAYKIKMQTRIHTLLVPFLFWNISVLLLYFLGQNISITSQFFFGNQELISNFSFYDFVDEIVGITSNPISYQFWFIRDLIILGLCSPLLYIMLIKRRLAYLVLLVTIVSWMFSFWSLSFLSVESIFFFSLGAFLSVSKTNIFCLDRYGKLILLIYFIVLCIDIYTKGSYFNAYLHKVGIVFGVGTAIFISQYMVKIVRLKNTLLHFEKYSFFIFAIHEPLLTIVKKILNISLSLLPFPFIICVYLALPFLITFIAILIFKILNIYFPATLKLVTGRG